MRGELAVGTGVADRHVAKTERAKEVFVVEPDGALAGDELHRLGGQLEAQAAVGVLDVRLVHVDAVEDDVLQMRVAHAAELAVARQAAGVVEALAERGHVRIVLRIVGEDRGQRIVQGDQALIQELAEQQRR